jgi:hypothetical protein
MSDLEHGSPRPLAADEELSPQELLELIKSQHEGAARDLCVDPAQILASWGVAWTLGFGAFYFASSGARWHFLPLWAATVVLVALSALALAGVVTQTARRGRGVQGPSRTVSARYGWSWPLAFAGVFALNAGLSEHGLPASLGPLLWPGSSAVVVGVLYLAGGALFADDVQYGLGAWMLAVGAGSVQAGWPANFAVLALAGGGGFLAAAAFILARGRHARPQA